MGNVMDYILVYESDVSCTGLDRKTLFVALNET